ncbi:MAG: nucleotide pyrophosphohydrolase [Geobacter sp.]|nr:nucleotide pyrophosphohydrolase [Geobacter sp.]
MSLTIDDIKKMQSEFDYTLRPEFSFRSTTGEIRLEELEHLLVCLFGEIGELANIVKKIRRGDFPYSEKSDEVSEEVIDALIYIIKISNYLNIDLEDGFLRKLAINKERFKGK